MGIEVNAAQAPRVVVKSVALVVALCFCVTLLEGFDIQALGISLGKLTKQFGLSATERTLLTTFSSVGIVLGAIIGGRLADFYGRKPVLVSAVAGFGVFTLAMIAAPNFELLFIFRLLAGLGFGAALPIMMAVASEISSPDRKSMTAALMFSGMPSGGGSSALLTQYLGPDFDWHTLFLIGGALPLVLVPLIATLMPETRGRHSLSHQSPGALWHALFAEGRVWPTLLLWLTFLPTMTILYMILNWLPSLMTSKGFVGTVPAQASMLFNYGSVFGAVLFAAFVDRMGTRWPLVISYVALIGSLLALGGATEPGPAIWISGLTGFLLLGANYALYGAAAAYYPRRVRGTGSGACVSVGRVGSIIGPLLAGVWLGGGTAAAQVIGYMAPFAAVAGIAVFLLGGYAQSED